MFDESGRTRKTPRDYDNLACALKAWSFLVTVPLLFGRVRSQTAMLAQKSPFVLHS
jgi:hypothetical protein